MCALCGPLIPSIQHTAQVPRNELVLHEDQKRSGRIECLTGKLAPSAWQILHVASIRETCESGRGGSCCWGGGTPSSSSGGILAKPLDPGHACVIVCVMWVIHTYMHTFIHAYMHACIHAYMHAYKYIHCKTRTRQRHTPTNPNNPIKSHRRLGGTKRQLTPIGKSVSVSFRVRVVRACVRACEAVWVRERGAPQRWGLERKQIPLRPGVVFLCFW